MKTQTLNTVFTGNAGPLQSEVNKLVSNVNNALSGISARAQSALGVSRTTGLPSGGTQEAGRLESITGIKGLTAGLVEMQRMKTMGAAGGIDMVLGKMGVNPEKFWKEQDQAKRAQMIGQNFNKLSQRDQMIFGDILGGQGEAWMQYTAQTKLHPKTAEASVITASKAAAVDAKAQKDLEELGLVKRNVTGSIKDAAARGFFTLPDRSEIEQKSKAPPMIPKEVTDVLGQMFTGPSNERPRNYGKATAYDMAEFQKQQAAHLKDIATHTKTTAEAVK